MSPSTHKRKWVFMCITLSYHYVRFAVLFAIAFLLFRKILINTCLFLEVIAVAITVIIIATKIIRAVKQFISIFKKFTRFFSWFLHLFILNECGLKLLLFFPFCSLFIFSWWFLFTSLLVIRWYSCSDEPPVAPSCYVIQ